VETLRRKPILTATAVGLTAIAAIMQYTVPSMVPALQRTPGALAAGQWWRLLTPLLVQTLGWYQVVTNLVTLALVGVIAERQLGRGRWLLLFAAGTIGGQIAAYAWQETGGGDSIAICGLAGGSLIWLLSGRGETTRWNAAVLACYVAALTGWGFAGIRFAAAAVVVAVLVLCFNRRLALIATLPCAVALTFAADLHGISLLSGVIAALIITIATRHQRSTCGNATWQRPRPVLDP
jgi:membrane associated rhomboid family serine protease